MFKLGEAQDGRALSDEEILLRIELKMKCLNLASFCRAIARQWSRLTFLREGDANTIFSSPSMPQKSQEHDHLVLAQWGGYRQ
jgi:hypothetical protein